jgi:hypothetical protein
MANHNVIKKDGEGKITLFGHVIRTQEGGNYLAMETKEIVGSDGVSKSVPALYHEHSSTNNCGFYFEEGKTSYKIKTADNTQPMPKVIFGSSETKILGAVVFGETETDTGFSYKPVEGGYNLYVTA